MLPDSDHADGQPACVSTDATGSSTKDAGGQLIDEVTRFGKPFAWTYRMSNTENSR